MIRVDPEGYTQLLDAVGLGSTAGGASVWDDGTRTSAWIPRPNQGPMESVVSNALRLMAVPASEIRKIRPPLVIPPPPDQFAYNKTPLTIEEVLETDRWTPQIRSWVSGNVRMARRADLQEEMWSGTERNVSMSVNPML
jgi:hypothetical protein